jgi:acetyl esterase/lipase
MRKHGLVIASIAAFAVALVLAFAYGAQAFEKARHIYYSYYYSGRYRVVSDVTYLTVNSWDGKLDVYQARAAHTPNPTLIYFHGGGWIGGSKEGAELTFIPFLDWGWNVVNVEYRGANIALAPAAVEDALCALKWVYSNGKDYNIDTNRLVLMGTSSGGHLALSAGTILESARLDILCPGAEEPKVAAIINWYGASDVNDLLSGPNVKDYAVSWFGAVPDRGEIAKRVSPLTYIRAGLPPVISIQGDADPVLPYAQDVRLHRALDEAHVPNRLVTIAGGKHGEFSDAEMSRAYAEIRAFLDKQTIIRDTVH